MGTVRHCFCFLLREQFYHQSTVIKMTHTLYWHYMKYECRKILPVLDGHSRHINKIEVRNEKRTVGSQTNCSPLTQNFGFGKLDMGLLKLLRSYYIEETEKSLQVNPASFKKIDKAFRLGIRESDSVTIAISAIRYTET